MPDKDYSKGKIYRIWCISGESDDVYVGSTIQSLAKRWGGHKAASRTEKNQQRRIYQTIAGDWDNWKIELIEYYPCTTIDELNRREGELIRETGTLNVQIAGRTLKEYREDNPDKFKQYYKEYHEHNKDKRCERSRQYYEQNKEKCNEFSRQYREQNKEKRNEQKRQYYEQNKEKARQYREQNKEKRSEQQRLYRARKKAEKAQAQ